MSFTQPLEEARRINVAGTHAVMELASEAYAGGALEAESLVNACDGPAAILRPSVVIGDSVTGWTPAFNVIDVPLMAFARNLLPSVPADPDGHADSG